MGLSVTNQDIFDFLELKRGEKLGCCVCGWNVWSARKIHNVEREDGPELSVTYFQLICSQCKHVEWFTDKVLDGP